MLQKHIILKWNEMPFFHEQAGDTIYLHAHILKQFAEVDSEQYVWWGKVSVSGYLGNVAEYIVEINQQAKKYATYLFLYCPDSPHPNMHVAKLLEISCDSQLYSEHTPVYYQDVAKQYAIPFWFKLADIACVPLYDTIRKLATVSKQNFDPVQVNYYPMIVYLESDQNFFKSRTMYQSLLGGYEMRCFKTGNECSFDITYEPGQVFIGCPFTRVFINIMEYAVKPVLQKMGWSVWIASDEVSNTDIMCKVCRAIQTAGRAIIDISGWNPNVLLELGLLYGNDKNVLIMKQQGECCPIDLSGIEYLEYDPNDFRALQNKLMLYFEREC